MKEKKKERNIYDGHFWNYRGVIRIILRIEQFEPIKILNKPTFPSEPSPKLLPQRCVLPLLSSSSP